jgi:hypothetical protein
MLSTSTSIQHQESAIRLAVKTNDPMDNFMDNFLAKNVVGTRGFLQNSLAHRTVGNGWKIV